MEAMKQKARAQIEEQLKGQAPGPLKLCMPCCGGPVGTMEKFMFMVPAVEKEISRHISRCEGRMEEASDRIAQADKLGASILQQIHHIASPTELSSLDRYADNWSAARTADTQDKRNKERDHLLETSRRIDDLVNKLVVCNSEPDSETACAVEFIDNEINQVLRIVDDLRLAVVGAKEAMGAKLTSVVEVERKGICDSVEVAHQGIFNFVELAANQVKAENVLLRSLLEKQTASLCQEEAKFAEANADVAYAPYKQVLDNQIIVSEKLNTVASKEREIEELRASVRRTREKLNTVASEEREIEELRPTKRRKSCFIQ